ncbi:MAG TPA: ABC transporter permease [Solirubrobacteraceae bacterium]|nr:ABC transporter permease [Solirubrobacteraceae bacterium]
MAVLVAANLRRRAARTFLTAAGVAVGVAAVVALLALSTGLNDTAAQFVHLGRADLGLFQRDAGDPTSSVLPLSLLPRVRAQPEVAEVTPIQLLIGAVKGAPSAIVLGLDPSGFAARQLVITAGHGIAPGQAAVGDLLAGQLHLQPGARLTIDGHSLPVGGIFHTGLSYEDSGVLLTLADAQALAGRTSQEATTFAVKLRAQTPEARAERELTRALPGVVPIANPGEAVRAGASTVLISKAVTLVVVLALIIGGLAVANTMLAALLERRRELALLATIGWSARQLGALVLGESIAVSMLGTGAGILLGLAASKLLPNALGLGGFISPALTGWGIGRAALIGIAIGVLGAIYPVWRVTRMHSVVALAQI